MKRLFGRLLCLLGFHRESIVAAFRHPRRNAIYGVKCARCQRPRLSTAGARPRPADMLDRSPPDIHSLALNWLEQESGGPVVPVIWWR